MIQHKLDNEMGFHELGNSMLIVSYDSDRKRKRIKFLIILYWFQSLDNTGLYVYETSERRLCV